MQNKWTTCCWRDIATLEYGKRLSGYESSDSQYPVYGTNGLIGRHSEFLYPHAGVIIGRKGAYRGVHYSREPFFVIDTAFYLKPKIELDMRWAYYELLTKNINDIDTGSAIPSTNREIFYGLPVKLPPLPIQNRIADILGALDDKIECNRRINKTLEQMARALYKHWFIDFGPFRQESFTKCETNEGIKSIPKSFECVKFGDLIRSATGGDWGKEQAEGDFTEEVQIIRGTDFPDITSGGVGRCPIRFIKVSSLTKRQLRGDDLLIEISGGSTDQPTGRSLIINPSVIRRFKLPLICASFCRLLRANSSEESLILYLHLRHIYELGKTAFYENQPIGIRNFQYTFFAETEDVFIPKDKGLLQQFSAKVSPLLDRMQSNETEYLAQMRDYLLPKLISGEVEVESAEKDVAEIV